jgi:hypothetical protein
MIYSDPITNTSFPNLFQASDAASRNSQLYYLIIVGMDLVFMIIAETIAIYDYKCITAKVYLYV